jgi:hypothetical protein
MKVMKPVVYKIKEVLYPLPIMKTEKLIRVIEKYKDVSYPFCYLFCIQSLQVGKLLMTDTFPKEIFKKQYNLKIKKGKTSVTWIPMVKFLPKISTTKTISPC